ncbi:MAG TPA: crossover junction endodeoxyribonuclease RuvC [Candidatus Kapabacteria bacterium]|nr:crossover junction endodeoxyribonuclease RuvC [Candidatus Kapabacteria bacterium]HYM36628.1 crossover junction endodeoxyribonuclease RuvC [Steroidobacteraceae bacterium]
MIILGIDPGTIVTGYGVIEIDKRSANRFRLVEFGAIEAKKMDVMPKRLVTIFRRLSAVIERTSPDECAIESAFYDKNVQSAMKLGQARGVAVVAAELAEIPVAEYAPRLVKKAVTGNGNASKAQVEFMVGKLVALGDEKQKLPDAYDALAVALTHALRHRAPGRAPTNWKQFIESHPERIKNVRKRS